MRQIFFVLAAATGLTAMLSPGPRPIPKVIFFDDFNTGTLDRSKWNVETTGAHYNNELQAYVDSAKTL